MVGPGGAGPSGNGKPRRNKPQNKRPHGPPNLGMPNQGPQLPPNKAGGTDGYGGFPGGGGPIGRDGPYAGGGAALGIKKNHVGDANPNKPGYQSPMLGGDNAGQMGTWKNQQSYNNWNNPQGPQPSQPGAIMGGGQNLGAVGSPAYNAYLASLGKSLDPMGNVVKTGSYIPQGMLPGGPTGVATYQNQGGGLNYDPSVMAKFNNFTDPNNIPQGAQTLLGQGNPGTYGGSAPGQKQMPPGPYDSFMPPGGGVPNQPLPPGLPNKFPRPGIQPQPPGPYNQPSRGGVPGSGISGLLDQQYMQPRVR